MAESENGNGFDILHRPVQKQRESVLLKGASGERVKAKKPINMGETTELMTMAGTVENARCQHPFSVTPSDVDSEMPTGDGPPGKNRRCKSNQPRWQNNQQGKEDRPNIGPKHREGKQTNR